MKKALLIFCIAALLPAAASADIIGTWSYEDAGTLDRWVLTVTPTAGETMDAFDIAVYEKTYRPLFVTGSDPIFKSGKDADTSFLLDLSHTIANPPPPTTVDDLVSLSSSEGDYWIQGAFSWAAGGNYDGGWSEPLELLEILVEKGSELTSADLVLKDTNWDGPALAEIGGVKVPITMVPVPEPSTVVLLVTGLIGLLAYAWRKRK